MLGIVIGVGAVITMVALGSGAQQAVQDRIQRLGPTLLTVFSGQDFRGGVAVSGAREPHARRRARARRAMPATSTASRPSWSAACRSSTATRTSTRTSSARRRTSSPCGATRSPPAACSPRARTPRAAAYAVLGAAIPDQLHADRDAMIGQEIQIGGIPFDRARRAEREGLRAPAAPTTTSSSRSRRRAIA